MLSVSEPAFPPFRAAWRNSPTWDNSRMFSAGDHFIFSVYSFFPPGWMNPVLFCCGYSQVFSLYRGGGRDLKTPDCFRRKVKGGGFLLLLFEE